MIWQVDTIVTFVQGRENVISIFKRMTSVVLKHIGMTAILFKNTKFIRFHHMFISRCNLFDFTTCLCLAVTDFTGTSKKILP